MSLRLCWWQTDLPNTMNAAETADKMDLRSLNIEWFIQACCATNGEGMYQGLDWLGTRLG